MSEELKPCPFCGVEARISSNRDWHKLEVDHDDDCILANGDPVAVFPADSGYRARMIEEWNRRTPAEQPAPASTWREVLEKALYALKEATSLRNLGFNELHAQNSMNGQDDTGSTKADYAASAERIEALIRDARISIRKALVQPVAARELDVEAEREACAAICHRLEAMMVQGGGETRPGERLAQAARLIRERAARSAAQGTAPAPGNDEIALRRLLAYRVGGALLYTDDGELQDTTTHPWIDFKRDSVESIEANLRKRTEAELATQPESAPVSTEQAGDAWISVDDRLPEKECLAAYVTPNGKVRLIRAKYARKFQIEAEGDDCEIEYNEDDDTFYIKAGWLECIDNWGEYSSCYVVEGVVTHWQHLPAAPSPNNSPVGGKGDE